MARTVQCVYLKKEAEGLDFPTYPGELGKRIYNEISKEAWASLAEAPDHAGQREPAEPGRPARAPVPGAADGAVLVRRRRRQAGRLRAAQRLSDRGSCDQFPAPASGR